MQTSQKKPTHSLSPARRPKSAFNEPKHTHQIDLVSPKIKPNKAKQQQQEADIRHSMQKFKLESKSKPSLQRSQEEEKKEHKLPPKSAQKSTRIEPMRQSETRLEPKVISLSQRTYLYHREQLSILEDNELEIKSYTFPLNTLAKQGILDTICAFLNKDGGRIYIGINEESRVGGIDLKLNEMGKLRDEVLESLLGFYPPARSEERVSVQFVPVKDMISNDQIEGKFVVKIIVKPGRKDTLYSVDKDVPRCFLRRDHANFLLKTEEIFAEVIKRSKNKPATNDSKFNDPLPEPFVFKSGSPSQASSPVNMNHHDSSSQIDLRISGGIKIHYFFPKLENDKKEVEHFVWIKNKHASKLLLDLCKIFDREPSKETRKSLLVFRSPNDAADFIKTIKEEVKPKQKLFHAVYSA